MHVSVKLSKMCVGDVVPFNGLKCLPVMTPTRSQPFNAFSQYLLSLAALH